MELFERIKRAGVENVRISREEWRKEYANTYAILGLGKYSDDELIAAAEDIITIYLMLQAENK
jgi:hypothetical protein